MSKICVITGATSGIGEAVALQLAELGWQLVVIGRSADKGEALVAKIRAASPLCPVEYFLADLSSVGSIRNAASSISAKHPVIDALINNAGGVHSDFELSEDGIEKTMAGNHINFYVLTLSLIKSLKRSEDARIVSVSSNTHYKVKLNFESFTKDTGYFILRAYAQSKLANVMFTYALARRLTDTNISAFVIHPGVVGTPIGGKSRKKLHRFAWKLFTILRKKITPEESAKTYTYLTNDPEAKIHRGSYFHAGVLGRSSEYSYDEEVQEKLWEWSEEVTGVTFSL